MTRDDIIKMMEKARTISGFILTPSVASLKKVSRPALDAGIGAPFFLLLMRCAFYATVLKRNVGKGTFNVWVFNKHIINEVRVLCVTCHDTEIATPKSCDW